MARYKIFYSFDYDEDVFRVQQIRNIGVLEGSEPVTPTSWETVKRGGDAAIKSWIDDGISKCDCVVCLIGEKTSRSKWVDYELRSAWSLRKPMFGIYIDDLRDPRYSTNAPLFGKSRRGANPFDEIVVGGIRLSSRLIVYIPNAGDAYNDIARHIETWIMGHMK